MLRQFLKLKQSLLREPISAETHLFLSERKKPYSTRGIRYRVKHWFTVCGFNPRLSCHANRHSYVSHLIRSGVDLERFAYKPGIHRLRRPHFIVTPFGPISMTSVFILPRTTESGKIGQIRDQRIEDF